MFQPPAPEIDGNAWAICPWLSRTAGHVILKPAALDIIQARLIRSSEGFARSMIDGLIPATQQAAEAFRRFGVVVAPALKGAMRKAAESTAGLRERKA